MKHELPNTNQYARCFVVRVNRTDASLAVVVSKWGEKWAGANVEHARPKVSLALVRFAHEDAVTATTKQPLNSVKCG
ncbi:hypothetical protein Halar_2004 [halophilic archaeon DL31]|jgi:hypothetical protein|nr:hypothetical protein Halar_2004 [halophilic archaeon DL31]